MSGDIRVVIADDNQEFCELLAQAINAENDMMCVACAHDGEKAIQAVRETAPDVLILDHVMPNLDGLGVLERLKGMEPRPRIVMLTAFGQESLIQRAGELGADYYLMKPFDVPTLILRIRQLAGRDRTAARAPPLGEVKGDDEAVLGPGRDPHLGWNIYFFSADVQRATSSGVRFP